MPQPEKLVALLERDPLFAEDAEGNPLARARVCECGRHFTQRLLSARFLAIVERQTRHAIEVLAQQIPGYYIPVHCPQCERRDIGMQARRDDIRRENTHPQPFGEAAD